MRPTVSVICPVWGTNPKFKKCLESVFNQSFRDFELVIIDDGSVQPIEVSPPVADAINVKRVAHSHNRGAAAARNTGAAIATGEWLAFVDSDDEWAPGKLAEQIDFALKHHTASRLQAIATGCLMNDHQMRKKFSFIPRPATTIQDFSLGCWFCPGSTLLIKTQTFRTLGGFEETLMRLEDYEFFLRFAYAGGELLVIPKILATINLLQPPDIDRVARAADYIVEHHGSAADATTSRDIKAFCSLARASAYFRNNRYLPSLWQFARSILLKPRATIQLADLQYAIDWHPDAPDQADASTIKPSTSHD